MLRFPNGQEEETFSILSEDTEDLKFKIVIFFLVNLP